MKSYLEYFNKEGKDTHFIYLDGKEENRKPKSRDLIIISDIKEFISTLKQFINEQRTIEKNLPKVTENTSTIDYKSPGYHIDRLHRNEVIPGLSRGQLYSDLRTSSSF